MATDVVVYQNLISSQHRGRPRFMAEITALTQPLVDIQAALTALPAKFDLDRAIGVQLDAVGLWVGAGRQVELALTDFYFAFDQPSVGWDQGRWKGRFDDEDYAYNLDDDTFRLLIRSRIAANHWDGTMAGAQAAYAFTFNNPASRVFVQDNLDLTYTLAVAGNPLSNIETALLTGNHLPIRAVTIRLAGVVNTTISGTALFGFDNSNSQVAGWDTGVWGRYIP